MGRDTRESDEEDGIYNNQPTWSLSTTALYPSHDASCFREAGSRSVARGYLGLLRRSHEVGPSQAQKSRVIGKEERETWSVARVGATYVRHVS